MVFSLVVISLEALFLQIFRLEFLEIMTNERPVLAIAEPILTYFIFNVVVEGTRGYYRGLVRALELQNEVIMPAFISQWIINPGLIYLLVFVWSWKLEGIWIALIVSELYFVFAQFYIL